MSGRLEGRPLDADATTGRYIDELVARHKEPEWMRQHRLSALQQAMAAAGGEEADGCRWQDIRPLAPLVSGAPADLPFGDAASVLAALDGQVVARRICQDASGRVIFSGLQDAAADHADILRRYAGTALPAAEGSLAALAYAFRNGGAFLSVPAGLELTVPFHILSRWQPGAYGAVLHTVVAAGAGTVVNVVETVESADNCARTHIHIVEIFAGAGAQVQYTAIQNWGPLSACHTIRRALVERDAHVEWVIGTLGGEVGRERTEAKLVGPGGQAGMLMVCCAGREQRLELTARIDHLAPHTASDILARGVAGQQAHTAQHGLTTISPAARFATAYQRINSLMLSAQARATAIPALEIRQDEVQAGHAVTTGQIDENHLFYLMSRGLTRQAATKIVVDGFLMPILQRIPLDEGRQSLQALIDRNIDEWM